MSILGIAGMGIGAFQSLFGGGNPNEWAMGAAQDYDRQAQTWLDPNNKFYTTAKKGYYKDMTRSLSALMPGTNSLLSATGLMQGGNYGGSVMQANLMRKNMMSKGYDLAAGSTERFGNSLYQQGLGQYQNLKNLGGQMRSIYGGGAMQQQEYAGSFGNSMMGLGGGLLAQSDWGGGNGSYDFGFRPGSDIYNTGGNYYQGNQRRKR